MKKSYAFYLGIVGVLLAMVGRAVFARPATEPRATDVRNANRGLGGGTDDRLSVPEGEWVSGIGIIEPRERETRLGTVASGIVQKILVKEGDRVKAGDLLVELDSAVDSAAVASAIADWNASEAEALRTQNGSRTEDRDAADADARAAEARAKLSAGSADRLRVAHAGGGATLDELDRAVRQAEADKATAQSLTARLSALRTGSRAEDRLLARARAESAKARVAEAKARLEQKALRSPIDAEVLQVKARVGEHFSPGGDPVVVLGDTKVLRARIDIDERDLGRLRTGARVLVRAAAFPNRDFEGQVVELGRRMGRKNLRSDDPVERNDTKILEVVADLKDPTGLLVGQRITGFVKP
jgi:multidrug resistance efflux pump